MTDQGNLRGSTTIEMCGTDGHKYHTDTGKYRTYLSDALSVDAARGSLSLSCKRGIADDASVTLDSYRRVIPLASRVIVLCM